MIISAAMHDPRAGPSVVVRLWADPRLLIACGFGLGLAPKAPGTFGTLLGLPIFWLLQPLSLGSYAAAVAALFILGIPLCGYAAQVFGRSDPPSVVWDEVVGLLVTLVAVPAGWVWLAAGFLVFRLFDIVKPWPIDWLDRHVPAGLGIMADDLMAGVYAWATIHSVAWALAR